MDSLFGSWVLNWSSAAAHLIPNLNLRSTRRAGYLHSAVCPDLLGGNRDQVHSLEVESMVRTLWVGLDIDPLPD